MDERLLAILRLVFQAGYARGLGMVPADSIVDKAWFEFSASVLNETGVEDLKLVYTARK